MKDFEIKYYKQKQKNMADTVKKWWQSKTIWGILIAAGGWFLSSVLQVPDVQLPANPDFDQLKAYADAIKAAQGNFTGIISQLIGLAGTVMAIIGRIQAGAKIG